MRRRTLVASGLAALAAACTPSLTTFNRLAPHDGGVDRPVRGAAFGPGPRQTLDVHRPAGLQGAAPVIVFFYGGSWNSGDRRDYSFMGDVFASHGFVTVIPDYRIAPDLFPLFNEDGARAVRWVQDHIAEHGGDPKRIVLVGHSAGAYITMMLALDAHYLRDAGVDASNIKGAVGLAGPYNFFPFDVDSTKAAFGQAPEPQLTQPVHFARGDAPPLFLAWGEKDTLVGRQNIITLSAAIRAHGGQVESKIYPKLDHVGLMLALSRLFRGRAPVLSDVLAFAHRVTAQGT